MKDNEIIYAIIKLTDIGLIDFSQVAQSSASTVRKSLDNTQFVVKWQDGYEPTFISDGSVKPIQILDHAHCLELMSTDKWSEEIEEKVEDEIKRR
tara:strand:+ start:1625 stop:1909 length:285 start_codon:yes stop_codon:yes gene_type:complete